MIFLRSFLTLPLMLLMATGLAAQENIDEIDADFLEFLAEVDEATGDGFEQWLEEDEKPISCKQANQKTILSCQEISQ